MAQILYRATGPDGQPTSGMVEADGVAQARDRLVAGGLRDVTILQEASFGVDVKALAAQSGADVQQIARVAVRMIEQPGLRSVLAEVWRGNRLPTIGFAALGVFSLATRAPLWAAGAFAIAALPFAWAAWSYRRTRDYEAFLRAHATGDWTRVHALADRLRTMAGKPENLDFDLDLRTAYARIRQGGSLEEAVATLEGRLWRNRLSAQPGAFDAQLALLHVAAEQPQGAVAAMRAAVQASGGEPMRRLDLALAEARWGDVQAAERELAAVDASLLPPYAAAFLAWTRASIARRRGDAHALALLTEAVRGMLELAPRHPAVWISLAVCTADLALAQRDAGQADAARAALAPVAPILRAHAPRAQLAELSDLLPPAHA